MFAIIHNLFKIVKWGQDAFRKWFKRELLGENWKIVTQAILEEQGGDIGKEGETADALRS